MPFHVESDKACSRRAYGLTPEVITACYRPITLFYVFSGDVSKLKYFRFSILMVFLVVRQTLESAPINLITGNSITKFDYSAHARVPDLKRGW